MTAPPEPLTRPARNVPERLSVALQAAWEDLSECTNEISQASAAVQPAPSAAPNLMAIRDWYQETTRVLLTEPVKKFMRLQPIRRTLGAMRACDQEISAAAVHARIRTDADFQRLQAYVYDHRFESAMKTDLLRRARHEFLTHRIVKAPEGDPTTTPRT